VTLSVNAVSSLVLAEHFASFPQAVRAIRENPDTGVPSHNVQDAFITALCSAYISSLKSMTILDIGGGTLGVPPGVAPPATFTFPGARASRDVFLSATGWTGVHASSAAKSYTENILKSVAQVGLLHMRENVLMAIGTSIVSPASNPGLLAAMQASLLTTLPAEMQACGKFAQDDIPGNPVNSVLADQLPRYALALATGTATMLSSITYAGTAGSPTAVVGAVNSGSIS